MTNKEDAQRLGFVEVTLIDALDDIRWARARNENTSASDLNNTLAGTYISLKNALPRLRADYEALMQEHEQPDLLTMEEEL